MQKGFVCDGCQAEAIKEFRSGLALLIDGQSFKPVVRVCKDCEIRYKKSKPQGDCIGQFIWRLALVAKLRKDIEVLKQENIQLVYSSQRTPFGMEDQV